jgi:hypothetical protein
VLQVNNGGVRQMSILGLPLFDNYYTLFDRTQNPPSQAQGAFIRSPQRSVVLNRTGW